MTLMRSERYRALFDHIQVTPEQNQIVTPQGGSLHFGTYGQTLVGRGFDLIIIDDPQSPEDAKDSKKCREVNNNFASSVVPRLNKGSTGKIILVQQRFHHNDLTSHLQSNSDPWNTLSIPAIHTQDRSWQHAFGEHTILKGTPICAQCDSLDDLRARLRSMGAEGFHAQFQQSPQLSDGRGNKYVQFAWARSPAGWDPNTGMCEYAALLIDKTDMLEEELLGGSRVLYTLIDPGHPMLYGNDKR